MDASVDILGLTSDELAARARELLPSGAGIATQLYPKIFDEGRLAIDDFPVAAGSGAAWRSRFGVGLLQVARVMEEPGEYGATAKAILRTHDGYEIECVRIPMRIAARPMSGVRCPVSLDDDDAANHGNGPSAHRADVAVDHETPDTGHRTPDCDAIHYTLCVSSQVGCKMGCTFCETGRMGLIRHLTAAEIVSQVVTVRAALGWRVRNLVFMGMGEALDNADNLIQALRVLTDRRGLHLSHERLTVCTSGHAEGLAKLAALGWKRLNLSISLNAATDAQRERIMPVNRKTPLAELQRLLAAYPQRRNFVLGVNYCLMPGLNDAREDAAGIAAFCRPLGRVLINLIPYNPGNAPLTRAPSEDEVVRFVAWLREEGLAVRRRVTKGRSIMAACGQLGNVELRRKKTPSSSASTPVTEQHS